MLGLVKIGKTTQLDVEDRMKQLFSTGVPVPFDCAFACQVKDATEVERALHYEDLKLPADLDYLQVSALSFEARQKLAKHRPETLGQAARISGITPASISLLLIHLKKGGFRGFATVAAESEVAA